MYRNTSAATMMTIRKEYDFGTIAIRFTSCVLFPTHNFRLILIAGGDGFRTINKN